MIRPILRYIAAPLLGHIGVTLLHVARDAEDRATTAELNEARTIGARDEARQTADRLSESLDGLRGDHAYTLDRMRELERERDAMRSELDSAAVDDEVHTFTAQALEETKAERDALRVQAREIVEIRAMNKDGIKELEDAKDALYLAQGERDELKDEDRKQRERIRESSDAHARDVNALRARVRELEGQIDARADVAPVEKCAWCLEPATTGSWCMGYDGPQFALCATHGPPHAEPSYSAVAARVALRARCHPARLTADPTADRCITCGAAAGEECRTEVVSTIPLG
jgi:hypothetical protein